jgi:hypothetical protein
MMMKGAALEVGKTIPYLTLIVHAIPVRHWLEIRCPSPVANYVAPQKSLLQLQCTTIV